MAELLDPLANGCGHQEVVGDVCDLLGFSPGIPGAATQTGTPISGIMAALYDESEAVNDGYTWLHELGHFIGLQHTTEPGNLMTQGQATQDCRPGLTNEQIASLREAATIAGPPETGLRRALAAHKAIVNRLMGR